MGNGPPNAILVVPAGEEAAFLAPLPVTELWGVDPKTGERLRRMGVSTIGELARLPQARLEQLFGKLGGDISRRARGIDDRPLEPEHETRSISKEITCARDVSDADTLRRALRQLADGVGQQVRKANLSGLTVRVKLRWADFTTVTRQITLRQPVMRDDEIYDAAQEIFTRAWPAGKPVRLLGVGLSGFEGMAARQLSLWEQPAADDDEHLQTALDSLRDRFGEGAVRRGSDLKRAK